MPKKSKSAKPKTTKKAKTVEEKIQELAGGKEPETTAPPQVMQVVEVTDEKIESIKVEEPVLAEEKPIETKSDLPEEEQPTDAKEHTEENGNEPTSLSEQDESKVSEFFSPSKQSSSVGYPNISIHKKSIAPILFWAVGVCLLVVAIGVGIITVTKGTFPISFVRPIPTPAPSPTPFVTPTPAVNKKELEVEILNGSGKAGVASTLKKLLEEKGYTVAGTGNAKNYDYAKTEIQVKADKEQFISVLQADLAGSYTIGSTSATLKESLPYNAVIIIGKE